MEISAGLLREVVKFEKNTPTEEDSGGELDVYAEFLTTRGKLRKVSGYRDLEAGGTMMNSGYALIVRYHQDLANELNDSNTVRVVINNRFFTIEDIQVFEERFNYYVFKLNEQHI